MLWAECLERLRKHVSDNHFTMWIRPLEAEEHSDCLKLYVPNPYWKSHIEKDYHEIISIMAEQISEGRVRQVDILVGSRPGKDILKQSEVPATTSAALQSAPSQNTTTHHPTPLTKATSNDSAKPRKVRQLNPALNFNLFVSFLRDLRIIKKWIIRNIPTRKRLTILVPTARPIISAINI